MIIHRGKNARNALWYLFFLMGIVSMAWVPRIPEIKHQLALSDGGLGLVLLGSTFGALIGSQVGGRLTHTFGSQRIAAVGALFMPGGLFLMGAAHQVLQLFTALFIMGFGYVMLDITVNTQAVAVEKILDRRWMSTFHGSWSVGSFVSTVTGGLLAHVISPQTELKVVAVIAFILYIPGIYFLLSGNEDEHKGEDGTSEGKLSFFDKTSLPLWAIGLGLLGCLLPEGAASDWGGVLLHEHMGIGKGADAIAFATFALAMITSRFLGDHWLAKYGPRRTVRVGGFFAGITWGLSIAIAVPLSAHAKVPAAIIICIGFAAAGLGIGPMVPAFMNAAARVPGVAPSVALARVNIIGLAAYFIGPTLTGGVSQLTSLPIALYISVLLLIFTGYQSRVISAAKD
ncbi:MAG: MFS transporter [Actinomycetes bacterium]